MASLPKDVLEAGKFINGTGTNEPFGVLTGTTTTVAAAITYNKAMAVPAGGWMRTSSASVRRTRRSSPSW